MNPKLSIVLPCYNEAGNVPLIVARLRELLRDRQDVEVILVNNGSKDNSAEVLAKELADPALAFIRVEHVKVNQGYGFGIMSGLRAARGEFLAWTHADMQTDPADVLKGFDQLLAARDPHNAFLKGRQPNFNKFRMRNKRELKQYLDGCARNLNEPPSMRKKAAQ